MQKVLFVSLNVILLFTLFPLNTLSSQALQIINKNENEKRVKLADGVEVLESSAKPKPRPLGSIAGGLNLSKTLGKVDKYLTASYGYYLSYEHNFDDLPVLKKFSKYKKQIPSLYIELGSLNYYSDNYNMQNKNISLGPLWRYKVKAIKGNIVFSPVLGVAFLNSKKTFVEQKAILENKSTTFFFQNIVSYEYELGRLVPNIQLRFAYAYDEQVSVNQIGVNIGVRLILY